MNDIYFVSSKKCINVWILNFGCSYNKMSQWEWFTILRSSEFIFIYLGDDKTCDITRMRKIRMFMDDNGV